MDPREKARAAASQRPNHRAQAADAAPRQAVDPGRNAPGAEGTRESSNLSKSARHAPSRKTMGPLKQEPRTYSPFVPLALAVTTLVVMLGFQSMQLLRERQILRTNFANQTTPVEEATNVRLQLDSIAKSTYALAARGNENAILVIERLKKAGIAINPSGAATSQ